MLIFTNREIDNPNGAAGFSRRFQPGGDTLALAEVQRAGAGFALTGVQAGVADDAVMHALVPLFRGDRPVLVYLHGNNNPPQACFERCARLQEIYGLTVVGFSWPSEGWLCTGDDLPRLPAGPDPVEADPELSLAGVRADNRREGAIERKKRHYLQAKMNAVDSGDALARFFRLLASARLYANQQRMTLAAHSLGCHFLQYAIENEGAAESLGAAHNIALLAACCRAEGHAGWVGKLHPKGQVFVTSNQGDSVLFGAYLVDGRQTKLGTDPGTRLVQPKLRYVDFTGSPTGLGGHGYFVRPAGENMPSAARRLFSRIFASEPDLADNERPGAVYRGGCEADGSACRMVPAPVEPGGPS